MFLNLIEMKYDKYHLHNQHDRNIHLFIYMANKKISEVCISMKIFNDSPYVKCIC